MEWRKNFLLATVNKKAPNNAQGIATHLSVMM